MKISVRQSAELQIFNFTQFVTQIHTKIWEFMIKYGKINENRKEKKMR